MAQWTNDQREAIEARHSNLLVSAAAGSGKTAVLVERIIQLVIQDGISIDEMLIVTFTNAAASEMRERIVEALYQALEHEENSFLREQVNKVQNAYIMTLHSFCIQVIRNNAHMIDLDPGFKVGDTVDLNLLMNEAVEMTLESRYESSSEDFITFVESFSDNRSDEKIIKLILDVYHFIQSQPEPLKWLDQSIELMNHRAFYYGLLKEYVVFHMTGLKELLEDCLIMTESSDGPLEYRDAILQDMNHVDLLQEGINVSLDAFLDSLSGLSHPNIGRIKKDRAEEIDSVLIDEVKTLREQYKNIIKDLQSFFANKSLEDYISDLMASQEMMRVLYQLVSQFQRHYQLLKEELNVVDFNDLEHMALKALTFETVKSYYQNKFKYIFLDEYQDSNLVQETLINAIKSKNNVFLVGDVKQSIYRFRLADPSLFMEKYNRYKKEDGFLDRRIDLKKNFRSRREILEGINFIFESLMSREFGEMTYDEDARLYPGLEFGEIEDPSIEVKLIETKIEDDLVLELSNAELEAMTIAKHIKSLLNKPSYNRKKDSYFPLDYKHMVILMRAASNWAPVFADVFMNEGIPLFADSQSGYFDTLEIKMFVDLLKIVDNPKQDIPLLTVLRSPIFDFTIDEIMSIRMNHPEGCYYEAIEAYRHEDATYNKICSFTSDLNKWRRKLLFEDLDEVLWHIMIDTGYYQYVGAMPGGKSRQGNLRLLIDRAGQYGQTRRLFGFLQLIDKMKLSNTEMGTAKIIGENENVVRIMTIHKSKGLEFPVVYVAGMGKKFNLRDAYQDILLHKHIGIGPKWVDPVNRIYCDTLPKKLIKHAIKYESLAEEMRVLYVALTRAVDKLILVGNVKDLMSASKKWTRGDRKIHLMAGQSYLDWTMSILSKHPAFSKLWDLAEKPYAGLSSHETKWRFDLIDKNELVLEKNHMSLTLEGRMKTAKSEICPETTDLLNQAFGYSYPFEIATYLPSKLSVSDLKKMKSKDVSEMLYKREELNKIPSFLAEEQKKSRAEIGTLMHYVMQKMDRHRSQEISRQIQELVDLDMIQEDELKYIDENKIKGFFSSSLGVRYTNAIHVYVEKPFVLKRELKDLLESESHDSVLLQGIIDCYFEEDDGIVLIDYKTDYIYGEDQILEERYKEQLGLYKMALESLTGKKVKESFIYSFFKEKSIQVHL
ncbi:MAG: helicase-exonuclease AddAB subunit AddA [Clostridia bacterium]|nr:helicase-exonuclease AddAB subunit AddA [Clostridia bacterium]